VTGVKKHARAAWCRNPNPAGTPFFLGVDYIEFPFPGVVSEEDALAGDIQPTKVDFNATDKEAFSKLEKKKADFMRSGKNKDPQFGLGNNSVR
jgi:hypothetical protein